MYNTSGKIVSPSGTMLRGISLKNPLLLKSANYICAAFKNHVAPVSFINWWKYIVPGSDTATLAYISVLLYVLMFMVVISPVMVGTKAYYCAYVGNLCPMLDRVLLLGYLASVCFSGTEGCTYGCCSSAGWCIGNFWVSYYLTGDIAPCYSHYGTFSPVVRPWSNWEINVDDELCCSEFANTNLFTFINPHMACQ